MGKAATLFCISALHVNIATDVKKKRKKSLSENNSKPLKSFILLYKSQMFNHKMDLCIERRRIVQGQHDLQVTSSVT